MEKVFLLALLVVTCYSVEAWKCSICKKIVSNFHEGLKKTAKSNFGGGNTRWEEKSLGTYAFSETRFVEIMENVCEEEKECYMMLEQFEETIEDWWEKDYRKGEVDLLHHLCIDKAKACCETGKYGPLCLDCQGGSDSPCRGHGTCNGDGTREGTGKCSCHSGYKGDVCADCADDHFRESAEGSETVCKPCHQSCGTGCLGPDTKDCNDCAEGYDETEEGCFDINECNADTKPCKDTEYCVNNEGSYTCKDCDKACHACTGPGANNCIVCDIKFYKDPEDNKCKGCHEACRGSCIDGTPETCDDCAEGWQIGENGCEDIDECTLEECEGDSFCTNTPGSYKCSTCHPYCKGCTGSGTSKCIECKDGYTKTGEKNACTDIDECADGACAGENERCINLPGSHRCECNDGFVSQDDKCVIKPKDPPKPKKSGKPTKKDDKKKKKTKAYKGPGTCETCKDIISNIKTGLEKTARNNFGGGNTRWEEEKLGKYMYSETRLTEILETVCEKGEKKKCYDMLEKYEETIEKWWFDHFAKNDDVDLYQWLCIERMLICCMNGTYGPECKNCIGGRERPCYGKGTCDGAGTRSGNGSCKCDTGYKGYQCDECDNLYYVVQQNDTDLECAACHESCESSCFDQGPDGCEDCKLGWDKEEGKGCVDEDECDDSKQCDDDQYCENLPGSFKCQECDEACSEKCIGPGPSNCEECAEMYYRDEQNTCKACHKSCANGCTDDTPKGCTTCQAGWEKTEEGCVDLNECELSMSKCTDGQYCRNTEGSHSCMKCDPSCSKCTGAGPEICTECNQGYEKSADGARCVDLNECLAEGGDSMCQGEHRVCVNTSPGYRCQCVEGYDETAGECVEKKKKAKPDKKKPQKKKKPPKSSSEKDESVDDQSKEDIKEEL